MTTPGRRPVQDEELARLLRGEHHDPHSILGPHPWGDGVTLRVLDPQAEGVVAHGAWGHSRLEREYRGVWVGTLPAPVAGGEGAPGPGWYRITSERRDGQVTLDDPYGFAPTLTADDLHLISEGRQELLWTKLGAHVRTLAGVTGASFAVWAPNALGVRVAPGSGPRDARALPMRRLGASGVWELFVPGIGPATTYQFEVFGADRVWRDKADPLAFGVAGASGASSRVVESRHVWDDGAWMAGRAERSARPGPMAVYEMHVGSWRRGRSWEQLADELPGYLADLGFTHVEFMPVMHYPFEGSWGYQVTSYFAPDARRGDPDGLRLLIDRLHQAGIGVILDWVPAHFAVDDWALARFDGTQLYEDPEPHRGWHPEWQTHIFNFGRPEVRNFLYASALYWLTEFHADGLRVDAVSSMLYLDYARPYGEWQPNRYGGNENLEAVQFLQELNATASRRIPGSVTVAEESTAWPGITRWEGRFGLGFGLKWNMGWMHDSLEYLRTAPEHRGWHRDTLTGTLGFAWSERYVLALSHDEVVHGKGSLLAKMPGDASARFATLRAYLGFMWAYPGRKLLFMGGELAQPHEWRALGELDWSLLADRDHAGVQALVRDLNGLYARTPALWSGDDDPEAFAWVDDPEPGSRAFSFVRTADAGPALVCVTNFGDVPLTGHRVGVPVAGEWEVVLNTASWRYHDSWDAPAYRVTADPEPWAGQRAGVRLGLPPLTTVWLRPVTAG